MITIHQIASSSSGNAYHVDDGYSPILIECGIQFKKIQKAIDFKVSELAGCLVTHEHLDHCKAVPDMLKAGINCYMTAGTADALNLKHHRAKIITPLKQFKIKNWIVLPFNTEHDAVEPVGFLLQSGEDKVLFATDTYFIQYKFHGLTYIMLECNYDINILLQNDLPTDHKKRVMRSHFSLKNVKEFLKANDLSRVREIHLLHLSDQNSDKARFVKEIKQLTGLPVYVKGGI